jgi:hypothetical protein
MKLGLGNSLPWALGILMLFVVVEAARTGAADLLCSYASERMAAWPLDGPSPSELERISDVLGVAHRLAPDNPDADENLARLDMVRAGMPGVGKVAGEASLRDGLIRIRRVIALRPSSPYGWAILLQLKQALGEYDAEFRRSLERAVTLGPWEPALQPVVVDAGLTAWKTLPEAERRLVGLELARGMKRQAATMFSIVRAHPGDCAGGEDCAQ